MCRSARVDLEPAAATASRFFTRDGVRLHVLDYGGAGGPVVFLHGGTAHAHWWDFVVPELGRGFHGYAPDLRGHGDSESSPVGAYAIDDHAVDLAALIEHFALERPAVVGHSFGCSVALRYAVDRPRSLAALVVVDGRASFGPTASRYLKLLGMMGRAEYPTLDDAVAKFRPLPAETTADSRVLEHVARSSFRKRGAAWTPKFDRVALSAHEPFDLEGRLAELACPVLFVRGEKSRVLTASTAARLAGACRDGSVVEIRGAHHHVPIDRPRELGAAIAGFLDRSAGRRGVR